MTQTQQRLKGCRSWALCDVCGVDLTENGCKMPCRPDISAKERPGNKPNASQGTTGSLTKCKSKCYVLDARVVLNGTLVRFLQVSVSSGLSKPEGRRGQRSGAPERGRPRRSSGGGKEHAVPKSEVQNTAPGLLS